MATYTSTVFANEPKAVHVGNMAVSGQYSFGATASSTGDVVFLAKIPHGAVIVDFMENHTTGATTQPISFGMALGGASGGAASFSCFIASGTQGAVNRLSVLGIPLTVSVSDNRTERWAPLAAKVEGGSATTSLIINWVCTYRMDSAS